MQIKSFSWLAYGLMAMIAMSSVLRAASTERLEVFLETTGFDVALESIRLSADAAPAMLGIEADAFGTRWKETVQRVFDTADMHAAAVDMLSQTLEPDLLDHAVDFYASDLGQRLVRAENASHLEEDDALKSESGESIIAGLVRIGAPRLQLLKRLNNASGSTDTSVHAIQEVQVRFLMAAASAGIIDLRMDEADLRETLAQQEGELRLQLQANGLSGSAYTYQAFSDDEIVAYAEALEDARMRRVYELMNAVQFQIMSDRFEALAREMQGFRPSQDL